MTTGPQRFQSPNSLHEWVPKDFPDDNFFLDGSFDPPLSLTGEDSKRDACLKTSQTLQDAHFKPLMAKMLVRGYKSYLLHRP